MAKIKMSDVDRLTGDYHKDVTSLMEEIESLKAMVERYQKMVCQTCDGHGAVGNILDSMDCPDCTLLGNQQQEIEELKSQNLKLAASLHLTISHEWCDDNYEQAKTALRANQKQCLASVKADAVKAYVDSFDGNCSVKVYKSWIKKDGAHYANKLREGKS